MESSLTGQRQLFDIPLDVAYFDCATISPIPKASLQACGLGVARELRPWNLTASSFFEDAEACRALAGGLIGATADDVAIIPGAAYGAAIAAANIPIARHQDILILEGQHTANAYSWRKAAASADARVRTLKRPAGGDWTAVVLEAISPATAVAALPHCHSSDGRPLDLVLIGRYLREQGAALVIDATHSLGARFLDVREVQPDFLFSACYKWLLGPYATGILYVAPKHQNGVSIEEPGLNRANSGNFAGNTAHLEGYLPGARRYDVSGRGNFGLLPGLEASLRLVGAIGIKQIEKFLAKTVREIAAEVLALKLPLASAPQAHGHYVSIECAPGAHDQLIGEMANRGVHTSIRGNWMRLTPHIYNTPGDVDRLLQALRGAIG
jgi:selenocysteine lyase/cysteine desulfurase